MLMSGAIHPVYQLMKEQEVAINWGDFIKPVVAYYSKDGNLYSMPFNSSSPILYYNKDAFQRRPASTPRSPRRRGRRSVRPRSRSWLAGAAKCGFSTAWPSWTMLENMFPWHDQPFATNQNGFNGIDTKLLINEEFGHKHIVPARGVAEGRRSTRTGDGRAH